MQARALDRPQQEPMTGESVVELCNLAATGLVAMLDPERQLFCYTYARTEGGMKRQGLSHRYTMMTLLGLRRYETAGQSSPIEIAPVLDALLSDLSWVESAGDLGLLLWTCAELAPELLPEIYRKAGAVDALERFPDGRLGSTMEVAWYLTGLATCVIAGHDELPGLAEQLVAARRILDGNRGRSGIYGHRSRGAWLDGYVRGRVGSFADQVYPTIAFARLSRALKDDAARQTALQTAQRICSLQGPRGEWCWQYDSASGRVVSRYPVYSVHQHAMGPMMLFEAGEACGCDFAGPVQRGLAWISGNNEIGRDFIEPTLGLVWRSIYLKKVNAYADAALRFSRLRSGTASDLNICFECRPYELGWLLYAFAGRKQ